MGVGTVTIAMTVMSIGAMMFVAMMMRANPRSSKQLLLAASCSLPRNGPSNVLKYMRNI